MTSERAPDERKALGRGEPTPVSIIMGPEMRDSLSQHQRIAHAKMTGDHSALTEDDYSHMDRVRREQEREDRRERIAGHIVAILEELGL